VAGRFFWMQARLVAISPLKNETQRDERPVVVLGAELEVAQHDCDLAARDDEDDEHEREEAKQVVELLQPHGREDEEQLDEHGAKGQHAADEAAERGVHVPGLRSLHALSI
jgi:hypothetical protein